MSRMQHDSKVRSAPWHHQAAAPWRCIHRMQRSAADVTILSEMVAIFAAVARRICYVSSTDCSLEGIVVKLSHEIPQSEGRWHENWECLQGTRSLGRKDIAAWSQHAYSRSDKLAQIIPRGPPNLPTSPYAYGRIMFFGLRLLQWSSSQDTEGGFAIYCCLLTLVQNSDRRT